MIPSEVIEESNTLGFKGVDELVLSSGETVYLLISNGGKVGLPLYIHYVNGLMTISTYEESMALFNESSFLEE